MPTAVLNGQVGSARWRKGPQAPPCITASAVLGDPELLIMADLCMNWLYLQGFGKALTEDSFWLPSWSEGPSASSTAGRMEGEKLQEGPAVPHQFGRTCARGKPQPHWSPWAWGGQFQAPLIGPANPSGSVLYADPSCLFSCLNNPSAHEEAESQLVRKQSGLLFF